MQINRQANRWTE